MDFRTAARRLASDADITGMSLDPTMQDATNTSRPADPQLPPSTDGMDPATPGGPAPYNGAEPFGEPVVSDPMWLDPSEHPESKGPIPHVDGPDEDRTTLHNARRASYGAQNKRFR